ncbi:MAG: EAL domain-containing protein [Gammaproteobacteria bacterium]|nr:MAG: EAL domain-containing protein [Gammaproteobacteria bacterium]
MTEQHCVLVIDDDPDYAESQQEFLQDNGFTTITAITEAEALEIIENEPVEIALVDIRIGRGSGVELIRSLLNIKPDLVCIMVTAYASITTAVDAIRQGAYEYLTKPVNPEDLLATLTRAISVIKLHDERDMAKNALMREQERAQVTLEAIGDGVITTDITGRVEYMNPAAEKITNWTSSIAKGMQIDKVVVLRNELNNKTVDNPVYKCLREQQSLDVPKTVSLLRSDGSIITVEHSASPIRDHKRNIIGSVLVMRDITEAKILSEKISYQAQHDALTGLINRTEFERRLNSALTSAHKDDLNHVLLYIDLDQFKVVNDTCGHIAGDELLCQLTTLFTQSLFDNMTLARLGGDEFGLLIERATIEEGVHEASNLLKICKDFRFAWQDKTFTIGASIGMVTMNNNSESVVELLSQADTACYAAKDMGRNRIHIYEIGDSDLLQRRGEMQWVSKINKALDERRFCLYNQKIMSLQQQNSHGEHYELLVRMLDDDGQVIPPGAFIPAAERYNLMAMLDRHIITAAFKYFNNNRVYLDKLELCTINLSGQTLSDPSFVDDISALFELHDIQPEKICFEITETAAISHLKNAMKLINELKSMGCAFALDDFGSGLSSFAYLKNLPVDYLKIDGAFVKDMIDDPIDFAMVKSINEVGHVMGKQIIAEFVEDELILEKLRELGVDYAQGYAIGRPEKMTDCK